MTFTELSPQDLGLDMEPSPEKDLQKAKEMVAGSVPIIEDPPEATFDLPRGVMVAGTRETRVEVRELTGVDEEALAKYKTNSEFFDGVLSHGTVRIGSLDFASMSMPERQHHLAGLLLGEREQLYVAICKATFGDDKSLSYKCGYCGEEADVDLVLSRDLAPQVVEDLKETYTHVTTKGKVIEFRLVTGSDQQMVLDRKGASAADQNTILLSQCIISIDGKPVVDRTAAARDLSMRDRGAILKVLVEQQPSPNTTIEYECPACQGKTTLEVAWGDIFRP